MYRGLKHLKKKKRVLIATDSRGAGIQQQINRNQKLASLDDIKIDIRIIPGAKVNEIHTAIKTACTYHTYDLILVIGGICNLTDRVQWCGLQLLDYSSKDLQEIKGQFVSIREQYASKVIFATIPPASLMKYGQVKNRLEDLTKHIEVSLARKQRRLEKDLKLVNNWIRQNNKAYQATNLDLNKINTSNSIKRDINGVRYRKESFTAKNLYDGLHANMKLKEKWHKRTTDVIYQEMSK